ncbi:MAG TPA: hypothetical protein VFL97_07235 [Nitrococcus sp.]|nr:hypothetical protein [Nitrococcus sp.]
MGGWGPSDIIDSVYRFRYEGTGYWEDVPKLLALFCEQFAQSPAAVDDALREYVLWALRRWLSGEAESLDKAFGLGERKRPRERRTEDRRTRIATAVAARMRQGETLDPASEAVGEQFFMSGGAVRNIYSERKDTAHGLAELSEHFLKLLDDDAEAVP